MTRALPGPMSNYTESDRINDLREQLAQMTAERDAAIAERDEALAVARTTAAAAGRLRKSLTPVYDALRGLFGDLDDAIDVDGNAEAVAAGSAASATSSTLDVWKRKFPGRPADIIDALVLRGTANVTQLAAICKCGKDAIYTGVAKLKAAGVITKNGGQFSLVVR